MNTAQFRRQTWYNDAKKERLDIRCRLRDRQIAHFLALINRGHKSFTVDHITSECQVRFNFSDTIVWKSF